MPKEKKSKDRDKKKEKNEDEETDGKEETPPSPTSHLPKLPPISPLHFESLPISINDGDEKDDEDEKVIQQEELDDDFEEVSGEPGSEEEKQSFRIGLQCIYLPIHSQMDTSRQLSTCRDLVDALVKAFGYGKDPIFKKYWNDFDDDCFPSLRGQYGEPVENRAKDLVLDTLRQRKHIIDNDYDTFYNKSSFQSEKEYSNWKNEALMMNSIMTQNAKQARQKRFDCHVLVNVEETRFSQNKTLFGISSSMDVLYKIRRGNIENETYLMESKVVSGTIDRNSENALEISFVEPPLPLNVENGTVISIKFFYRYLKKTTRFAYVDIKVTDLIPKIEPPKCSWGSQPLTETFDLLSTETNAKIGVADITLNIQFQKFPNVAVEISPTRKDNTPYQDLFNILIDRLVKSRKNDAFDESALDFHQSWIVQEFSSRYNISEVTKRLAILSALNDRPDLMSTFSHYFRQSIDFLHNNNTHKFVHTTKQETRRFMNLVESLTETLEKVLINFKRYIRSKNKSMKDLLDIYQLLLSKYGDEIDEEEFEGHVKQCIETSLRNEYNRIHGDDIAGPVELIAICEKLMPVIRDIKKFSSAVPKYVSYEKLAIEILYNSFAEDFDKIGEQGFTGKEMLLFCDKLKELNDTVKEHFDESEREDVNMLDIDLLLEGTIRKYFKEIKTSQKQVVKRSITSDEWTPTSEKTPYSESIITLFKSAAEDLAFIKNLKHAEREIMIPKFAETVVETVSSYVDTLGQLCIKDMPIDDEGSEAKLRRVPEQFIVRISDIYVSKMHLMSWFNNMQETTGILDLPEEVDIDYDLLGDIKKYNEVQMHKRNKNMSIKLDTADDEEIKITAEQQVLIDINVTIADLLSLVTENYAPFIKVAITSVLQTMKKEIGKKRNRTIPDEEFFQRYAESVENLFIATVLDAYLAPLITEFARFSYDEIVSQLIHNVFVMVMQEMTSLIICEGDDEPFKPCKLYQLTMLKIMYLAVEHYFKKEKGAVGINRTQMERESRLLRNLFAMFNDTTPELINLYGQFVKYSSLNRASRVKDHHIIALLKTRRKDGMAKKFVTEHWKRNEEQRVITNFGLKFPDTEENILLYSAKCTDKKMHQEVCHLTKQAICVESRKGVLSKVRGQGGGLSKADLRSQKSVVTSHASRIFLTDITAMKTDSSLVLGKGIKVYFKDGVLRMYFKKAKHQEALYSEIIKQGKKLGNNKVENQDKNKKSKEK